MRIVSEITTEDYERKERLLRIVTKQKEMAEEELHRLKGQVYQLEKQGDERDGKIRELKILAEEELPLLEREKEMLEADLKKVQDELDSLKDALKDAKKKRDEREKEIEKLREGFSKEREELKKELDREREKREGKEEKIRSLEKEVESLRKKHQKELAGLSARIERAEKRAGAVGVQNFEPVSTVKQSTVSAKQSTASAHIQVSGIAIPKGFRHLRQATHSCGGQTHTVEEYVHEKTGMEFVLVPGGSFEKVEQEESQDGWGSLFDATDEEINEMGDTKWGDSKPIHTVSLKPFLMGKYQVIQKVWKKIMGDNPSNFKGEDRPVEKVSWHDCKKFCEKVGLSLPSEAQWEYACRAGTETKYYWGDSSSNIGDYAWYNGNSDDETHPVGQKKPNAYGLFDMAGNVWEWCEGWYASNYNDAPNDGSPYLDESSGYKAVRGGSWYGYFDSNFASAYRNYDMPAYQNLYRGFRVVACS